MSPESAPTRLTRVLGRWLCVATYLLCLVIAYADVFHPSDLLEPMNDTLVALTGLVTAILSIVGVIAVLAHRWRVEWVPASALTFLLLAQATPLWIDLDDHPTRLAAAAMMTLGALCIFKRALDLFVFSEKTRLAAHQGE